jgi:hypothetical protein
MSGTYKTDPLAAGDAGAMTTEPLRFDTKIAVLLRDDLAAWQELNVTAFLSAGIAASDTDLMGEPYADADGTTYLPLLRQPVVVLSGDRDRLRTAHRKAVDRGLATAIYTAQMFQTGHDAANREVVQAVGRDDLDLVGIAVHGARNAVDKTCKGAALHA